MFIYVYENFFPGMVRRKLSIDDGSLPSLLFPDYVCLRRNPQRKSHESVKAYRACRPSRSFISQRRREASAVPSWAGNVGTPMDGCVLTTVPWRTVKSARAMQIYGVTVNTAAERIIHSGAYLAERVHAFTLGTTDGRGSSYRNLGHTDTTWRVVVHTRTYARTNART